MCFYFMTYEILFTFYNIGYNVREEKMKTKWREEKRKTVREEYFYCMRYSLHFILYVVCKREKKMQWGEEEKEKLLREEKTKTWRQEKRKNCKRRETEKGSVGDSNQSCHYILSY